MPIVQCPNCNKKLNLKTPQPGKRLRCPGCSEPFVPVPAGKTAAAPKRKRPAPVNDFADEDFGDEDFNDDYGAAPAPRRSAAKSSGKRKKGTSAKKSKAPLFVGIGVIGVALVGGLLFMLMSGDDPPADAGVADAAEAAPDGADAGMEQALAEPDAASVLPGSEDAAPATAQAAAESGDAIDLQWLPPDSEVVARIDVERLLAGPLGQLLQNPLLQPQVEEMRQQTGFGPGDIRSVTLGVGGISAAAASGQPPRPEEQPLLVVVRANKSIDLAQLQKGIPGSSMVSEGGLSLIRIPQNPPIALWLADPSTAVIGVEAALQAVAAGSSPPKAIDSSLLNAASAIHVAFMPSNGDAVFRSAPLPPDSGNPAQQPLIDFLKVVQPTIAGVSLELDFGTDIAVSGTIKSNGSSAAQNTSVAMQKLVDWAKQMQNAQSSGQVPAPMQMAMNSGKAVLESFQVQTQGDASKFSMQAPGAGQQLAVMAPMMLPAIMQARTAARRTMSKNNLKQIALAMHNFHDTYQRFPNSAGKSPTGEKWLSWRVHLLPFLDQQDLYSRFALEEPWDSPTNRPLVEQMPDVFQSPNVPLEAGKTLYQVAVGPGTMFEDETGRALRDLTDGTSNTLMVVETSPERAVYWTQPDDLTFNPDSPMDGLGGVEPGGFQAALADGSVSLISGDLSSTMLKGLFTRNGGEDVSGAF